MYHVSPVNLHLAPWEELRPETDVELLDTRTMLQGSGFMADDDFELSAEISCTNAISSAITSH